MKEALNLVQRGVGSEIHLRRVFTKGNIQFAFISNILCPLSDAKLPRAAMDAKVRS